MKYPGILIIMLISSTFSFAQLTSSNKLDLIQKEDKMKDMAIGIVQAIFPEERRMADSIFTRQFVQALRVPHSFNYRFDSLYTISQLYAPDSSFRIFTWQLVLHEGATIQHGAIQMRTTDGSLKLFPLLDRSDITENITDTISDNLSWMGAVYYKIILKNHQNKAYYTLLGYDENDNSTTKKIIEVLTFNDGKPVFGDRIFNTKENAEIPKNISRYVMEYSNEASPRLTFDEELDLIVMEHLVSETNEPKKKSTLVGDGDYEGFKWENGKWNYITKIFNQVTPENVPPVPMTILDAEGNIDETKLPGFEKEEATPKKPKKENKKGNR